MSLLTEIEKTELVFYSNEKDADSRNEGLLKGLCKLAKKHRSIWPKLVIIFLIILVAGVTCLVVYYLYKPAENSVQLDGKPKKSSQVIGCSPKPVMKNILSLLSEKDDMGDYEIEEWLLPIYQCSDDFSFCGVNGNCTCEPTENGQTNVTAIIKFRNRHIKNSEWQYVHRTLNIKNHTECVGKAEISVQQQYENQKKLLDNIGCSPKPEVMNMLNLLPEKDDIKLEDYEIEERFIAIHQCNDYSSFCGVNEICRCEPTENGQTNATAIIKIKKRHMKNSEWQYVHRTLNIMNHTKCASKAI